MLQRQGVVIGAIPVERHVTVVAAVIVGAVVMFPRVFGDAAVEIIKNVRAPSLS